MVPPTRTSQVKSQPCIRISEGDTQIGSDCAPDRIAWYTIRCVSPDRVFSYTLICSWSPATMSDTSRNAWNTPSVVSASGPAVSVVSDHSVVLTASVPEYSSVIATGYPPIPTATALYPVSGAFWQRPRTYRVAPAGTGQ